MSTQSRSDLFKLFDQLNAESFKINPLYIDMTGTLNAGYLLTQLIFLARGFGYEEFYRTDEQLRIAYKFGSKELINARKTLVSLGLISTEFKKSPGSLRKWHYTINIDRIIDLAVQMPSFCPRPTPQTPTQEYSPKRRHVLAETATTTLRNGDIENELNNYLDNNKENIKRKNPLPAVACVIKGEFDNGFEEFYARYPKKIAKPKAKQAYAKAIKLIPLEQILKAIENQTAERAVKANVGAFVPEWPYPATWLNQGRWGDSTQSEQEVLKGAPKVKTKEAQRTGAFQVMQSIREMVNNRVPQLA